MFRSHNNKTGNTKADEGKDCLQNSVIGAEEAFGVMTKACKRTRLEDGLDKVGEKSEGLEELRSTTEEALRSIDTALNSDACKQLDDIVHDFMYEIPELVHVIELIGKVHPFVNVLVETFMTIYNHEKTRRNNDKKIMLVFVEMKEVLWVLQRLQDFNELNETLLSKLKELSESAAEEMKLCGNACDAYSKQCFAHKLFRSPNWNCRFAELIKMLQKRREDFVSAFSMISALDAHNSSNRIERMEKRQEDIIDLLNNSWAPEFKKYMRLLADNKSDSDKLENTLKANPSLFLSDIEMKAKSAEGDLVNKKLREVLEELKENVHSTAKDEEKNQEKFNQVFELQKKLNDDLKNAVAHESDRTIEEIKKTLNGPAGKIIDKDIHSIWQEGGWKGSVKARHFVLALRDYFHEKDESDKKSREQGLTQVMPDKWAFRYIDAPYLQPILEAIDDDASGFIRISEVNTFTSSRPGNWSLPWWIAFWAVGWHTFARKECTRITNIFNKMFSLLGSVKAENQKPVEDYLKCIWKEVSELTMSFDVKNHRTSHFLYNKFSPYVRGEKQRLQNSLELLKYDIDDYGTLRAVVGPGRIEKASVLCKDYVLAPEELLGAADSILCIMGAVRTRYHDLKALFTNQRLDPKLQLRSFEYGIFKYIDDPQTLWPGGLSDCERFVMTDDTESDLDELSTEKPGQEEEVDKAEEAEEVREEDTREILRDVPKSVVAMGRHGTGILRFPHKGKGESHESNLHHTVPHNYEFLCDCCGDQISTSRIICMDCVSSKGLWHTVNFCTKLTCAAKQTVLGRSDLRKAHNNEHNLLMLKRIPHVFLVLLAFYGKGEDSIYEHAMLTIKQTQNNIEKYAQGCICTVCKRPITLPCWTSISLPSASDAKQLDNVQALSSSPGYFCSECILKSDVRHERYHVFVRCTAENLDKDHSSEKIVSRLHDRLYAVEASQERLEEKLEILLKYLGCSMHSTPYHPTLHGHSY